MARTGVAGHLQEVEHASRPAPRLRDGEPAGLDEADREAPQQGRVLRSVADAAPILVEAPVKDVVIRLYAPVAAVQLKQALRSGGPGTQARDPVGDLGAPLAGPDLGDLAAHGEDLRRGTPRIR